MVAVRAPRRKSVPSFLGEDDASVRQRILVAALDLFANKGLDGTSIRDIAAAAGCTNPALYKHFDGKQAVALFLFEVCYSRLWSSQHAAVSAAEGFDAKLDAYVGRYLALLDESPEAMLFLNDHLRILWPHASPGLRRRSILAQARSLMLEARKEGRMRSVDPDLAAAAVVGTLVQFARMIHFGSLRRPAATWHAALVALIARVAD
ncbi:MAG: TetR/AcrR family transcriptional regulator [Myxococcaceae bacterium]|nr:MAG: TetR/AcrR family transcriptional regulator [Myxococcaceae bacterium]